MARRILFLILLFAVSVPGFAQLGNKVVDLQDYQYHHEASGGIRILTNGFSLFGEYGWIKNLRTTHLLQLEYSYYIDYRQKKSKSQVQDGRDYLFGLQNHFHIIRFGYGLKQTIIDKADRNGVRLTFVVFGCVSLGLLKPYYLNLIPQDTTGNITPERYSAANADRFLNQNYIVEAAPIHYGLNQIQPVPGAGCKVGLDFDWGKKDEFVKAIEAGVTLDVYYKRLPIMVNTENRFYQFALYLSFQFGKRW